MKSLSRALVLAATVLVTAATAATAGGGTAWAAPADDRATEVAVKDLERARLDRERADLDKRFHAALAEVDVLKRRRSSWANDRKLEAKQREAQELAKALGAKQGVLATVDRTLVDRRRALVSAIDLELGVASLDAGRRGKLEKQRADAQRRLPGTVRKLKVPDDRIDPLDDPEDLDDKARRLAAGETSLLAEIKRMDRRVRLLTEVAMLEKSRQRAGDDLFQDAQKGRRTGYSTPGTAGSRATADGENDTGGAVAPPLGGAPGAGPGAGSFDGAGNPEPSGVTGEVDDTASGANPVVAYADVVDAGTLEALRLAERSTDPAVKAKAAERARRDLEVKLTKLRARRLEMERRARSLRSED